MNDQKYGRLYPERAVAPLRDLLLILCDKITATPTATETVVTHAEILSALNKSDTLGFPEDEPLFLLRGQDIAAPDTVRFYFDRLDALGGAFDLDHATEHWEAMERWQPRKLPD